MFDIETEPGEESDEAPLYCGQAWDAVMVVARALHDRFLSDPTFRHYSCVDDAAPPSAAVYSPNDATSTPMSLSFVC